MEEKGELEKQGETPDRPLCAVHPTLPAGGICSKCNKPHCRGCLTYYEGSLLCLSCLKKTKRMSLVMTLTSLGVVIAFFCVAYIYLFPLIQSFLQQFLSP